MVDNCPLMIICNELLPISDKSFSLREITPGNSFIASKALFTALSFIRRGTSYFSLPSSTFTIGRSPFTITSGSFTRTLSKNTCTESVCWANSCTNQSENTATHIIRFIIFCLRVYRKIRQNRNIFTLSFAYEVLFSLIKKEDDSLFLLFLSA